MFISSPFSLLLSQIRSSVVDPGGKVYLDSARSAHGHNVFKMELEEDSWNMSGLCLGFWKHVE